ncbi:MAG: hypothetical protein ACREBE_07930, partial [bacterium]
MPPSGDPPYDPLLLNTPMEYRVELPVLGIPVRFATNDRAVFDHIEEVFGHWRGVEVDRALADAGADMTVLLHDGDEGLTSEPVLTYRAPDPMRWIVHTPGSVGVADLDRQSGVAYVTRALVNDSARFRVAVLQFLVLITITIKDRTPVHASLIGRGDAALLLVGAAGTGKSTLAYAAGKAGWDVLSDDAAYVQLSPPRVWGSGSSVLLLGDAAERFPELLGRRMTTFPTGKRKMMVAASAASPRRWASRAGICVLEQSSGPVRATRIPGDEIHRILTFDPAGAGVRFGDRLDRAAAWLSSRGGWRLTLSRDPAEAIPALEQMLAEVSAR